MNRDMVYTNPKTSEDAAFYRDFTTCIVELFRSIASVQDPQQAGLLLLEHVMKFYQCDWCGILKVDTNVGVWKPFWWVNTQGQMEETYFDPLEDVAHFARWEKALERHEPVIICDCEALKNEYPNEYECYQRNKAQSVIGYPFCQLVVGCLIVRNPKRYGTRAEFLEAVWQLAACCMQEKKIMDQEMEKRKWEDRNNLAHAFVRFFGKPEISTSEGRSSLDTVNVLAAWEIFAYLLIKADGCVEGPVLGEMFVDEGNDKSREKNSRTARDRMHAINDDFERISNRGDDLIKWVPKRGFRINPDIRLETDFNLFENYLYKADHANNKTAKIEYLKNALDLYRGDFFNGLVSTGWIFESCLDYQRQYFERVEQLANLLYMDSDFVNLQKYCAAAIALEPGQIRLYFWIIVALEKMRFFSRAKSVREKAIDFLIKEDRDELSECIQLLKNDKLLDMEWLAFEI